MLPMKSLALLEKAFSVLSGGRTTNKPMLYSLPTEGERPIFVHLTISVGFTKPQVSQRQKVLASRKTEDSYVYVESDINLEPVGTHCVRISERYLDKSM
jgi:hypothetical protein